MLHRCFTTVSQISSSICPTIHKFLNYRKKTVITFSLMVNHTGKQLWQQMGALWIVNI